MACAIYLPTGMSNPKMCLLYLSVSIKKFGMDFAPVTLGSIGFYFAKKTLRYNHEHSRMSCNTSQMVHDISQMVHECIKQMENGNKRLF